MKKDLKSGQIGLLLLVIIGVVVAIVMSVASRSLSDTVISRQEKESSAAFAVAETGVENALNELRQGTSSDSTVAFTDSSGNIAGEYLVSPTASYQLYVKEGESAHLDTTGLSGALTISWTKTNDTSENRSCVSEGSGNAPAAIEVMTIQESLSTAKFAYYNPYNCSNVAGNGFSVSSAGSSNMRSSISYSVPVGTSAIRIKPMYAGATIAVAGSGLGNQLYLIQSKASGGDARKEIEVRRGLDAPPSIFDYAVFSGDTIVKNN